MTPFNISEQSVAQLKALIARTPDVKPGQGIRIYISGICHGGPEWSLTLDDFDPALDECCDFDGLKVMIERELLDAVGGLDVQYESYDDDDEAGGFLITALDPEVQALYSGGGCGCGCGGGCHGCGGCHDCDDCDDCDDCGEECGDHCCGCHHHDDDNMM